MLLGVQRSLHYLGARKECDALFQYLRAYVQVLLVVQAETKQFFQSEIQDQGKITQSFSYYISMLFSTQSGRCISMLLYMLTMFSEDIKVPDCLAALKSL